jgi:dephospho-CoA kinase
MTIRIGLTGPIGCGKSTIAGWLGEHPGVVVIDADVVARAVVEPGEPALDAVVTRFGADIRRPDGSLDREALGRIVFADEAALRDLEAIVHPAVRTRILRAIDDAETTGQRAVVIEAIKLVEGGLAEICDEVWLVVCEPTAQARRLVDRGVNPDDAARRVATQQGLVARARPRATRVIDTSGDIEATRAAVDALRDTL